MTLPKLTNENLTQHVVDFLKFYIPKVDLLFPEIFSQNLKFHNHRFYPEMHIMLTLIGEQ